MRILRIQLTDFGRHRDLNMELAPGFTIIRGPNEAGKSTIQRAIELALYRKATASGSELEQLRTWSAGDEARLGTRLEFQVDDEDERTGRPRTRRGVLEKEFKGQRGRVSLELDGETITDPARADQVVSELTGVPNEQFFRSTASIRHEELDDLDRDEGALRDRLQGSVGGGDRGSSRAKTRLEDAIRSLRSRGDKNPGRLKIAEEAVARAETALRSGEAALERLERDRDALAAARVDRQHAERALSESRNMLEGARQADRLRSERAILSERFERYRQAADARLRLQALENMPERSLASLRETLDKMRTLQSRVVVLQETLREEQGPDVEPNEPVPGYKLWGFATGFFLVAAIALVLYGFMSGTTVASLVGIVLLAISAMLVYFFTERRTAAMVVIRANDARDRERAIRRQSKVGTEEGLRVATAGVQNILRELGVRDVASAEQLLSGEQSRRQEIATLQVQISALLAGQTDANVTGLRDQAALEMEQKSAALAGLGPIAVDARAREKLDAEVRERQDALERARDAEAAAQARVDANPVDAEAVAGEAERLATWREQLTGLRRRVRIYEATLAAIQSAETVTMQKATRFLEQQVGRDMARLTGGRYRKVAIDDRSLDVNVWTPEREDWVPASRLSKGTMDQVFLAARIGLVRLVTQGKRPPLILDDPFVTFDDQRAARAALLLRELSSDFQVIYLACSNRYDGLADAVVELAGPADVEAPASKQPEVTAETEATEIPLEASSAEGPSETPAETPAVDGAAAPSAAEDESAGAEPEASAGDVASVPDQPSAEGTIEVEPAPVEQEAAGDGAVAVGTAANETRVESKTAGEEVADAGR